MLGTSSAHPKVLEHDFEPSNYTFADGFCGAGGTSVGARDAGLHIKWAFDHDGDAIDTYALNHGRVRNFSKKLKLRMENRMWMSCTCPHHARALRWLRWLVGFLHKAEKSITNA